MKNLFKFALLLGLLLLGGSAFAEGLTESSVKAFIAQVDRAILRMDADAVGEALTRIFHEGFKIDENLLKNHFRITHQTA
jgi:hypothetical protein